MGRATKLLPFLLTSPSGFLNKAEKKGEPIFKDSEPVAIKAGFIEEVDSE